MTESGLARRFPSQPRRVRVLYTEQQADALYMGVGYNRGNGADPATPIPVSANPFLNVDGVSTKGYIISNTGVTLGVPASANSGFAMVKLVPEFHRLERHRHDRLGERHQRQRHRPAGRRHQLRVPDAAARHRPAQRLLRTGRHRHPGHVSGPGRVLRIQGPGHSNTSCPTPVAPTVVPCNVTAVNVGSSNIYLNTGREFFAGFDYLYDYDNGYVGYAWTGNVAQRRGNHRQLDLRCRADGCR